LGSFRFGEYEVDSELLVLRRSGQALPMQPRVFDVLLHLVERRGTVVTKAELLDALWRDEDVYDSVVAWSVSHIRRTLGQRGGRHPIETVANGYRFTAEVICSEPAPDERVRGPAGAPEVRPSEVRPSEVRSVAGASEVRSPLVGRGQVIAELAQQVEAARGGSGALCVLTGEAGIGKTRCVDELAMLARPRGVQVLYGRCPPDLAVPTLWPIAAAIAALVRDRPELAARARTLIAATTGTVATTPETARTDAPGDTRFRLIEQAASFLRELTAQQPALLILDDLHWADAGSLELLGFIAPELHAWPLSVVATLRDGELQTGSARGQPLRRLLRHARTIPLGAFDSAEVAELAQLIAHRRPSDALAEAMRQAARGIPLFVEEIVRSLLRQHGEQAWPSLGADTVRPPGLARDLLRERIQRLPAPTIELLSSAAVIGASFDLSLLMALVELEPDVLLERLEPALAGGELGSDAPHTYGFRHSLFQSVLYDDMPAPQRAAIHRKLGSLLLARPESERNLSEAARHLYLALPAAPPAEVMQAARSAGEAAQRAFAYENAVVHYGWALEAQLFETGVDTLVRAELLLLLGTAQRMAGRTSDALETSARALELAQQKRLSAIAVRAAQLRRPTVAMSMVPDAPARAALEAVIEQGPDEPSAARVGAMSLLACMPPYSSDLSRSKQLSARALELAAQLAEPEPTFEAMRARLFALSGPDDLDEVLEVADRMQAAAKQANAEWRAGDALTARYGAHILAGRIAEADAVLQQMTTAIRAWHVPEGTFFCERLAAQRRFLDGHFDEADQRWKVLHARAVRAGVSYADMFYGVHTYTANLERRGPSAVVSQLGVSDGVLAGFTPYTRAAFARNAAEAGEHELARGQLSVLGDPLGFPRDAHFLHLLANLAACASCVGDKPRCEQLQALLAPYAGLNTPSQLGYYMGSVAYFLGLLAVALGRPRAAADDFDRALAHNEAMGYRAGVARTLLARARLAAELGQRASAQELFGAAREEARALGMLALLKDAEAGMRSS
jgi:DNA-binding winged helix-turn-helix (wHTH) protein/tetratricopeptide (TPR) repeat protein